VRFVSPHFANQKIAGFLALEASLAVLMVACVWAVVAGSSDAYRGEEDELDEEDEDSELAGL
jgi:hypothetical protein